MPFCRSTLSVLTLSVLTLAGAQAQTTHMVTVESIADRKAVFATVESIDTIAARARIGGTIGELRVDEGDAVEAGGVLAVVVDDRLTPQIGAVNAQAAALEAQLSQARIDLERAQDLFDRGIFPQARLDQAETAVTVLEGQLASARQERAVLVQQSREGDVLAPSAGRVLQVPVTAGSVVMPGEAVAMIASDIYLLRLRLPERHARSIEEGDPVFIDAGALTDTLAPTGRIRQVYPQIQDGRVIADATLEGLGDYFVGERVRVMIEIDQRDAILIPSDFVTTRFGIDQVHLQEDGHEVRTVIVQLGQSFGDRVEVLTGIGTGDVLVQP